MKTKTVKTLPKTAEEITNGGIYSQRVRCGKKNCKCARGETHSAFYFFTSRHGKLVKFYVRKADIEAFTELVNRAAFNRKRERLTIKESNKLFRQLRETVQDVNTLTKLYKEIYENERS